MQQWHEIRVKLADDILLMFRLGDFYEIFDKDAERGAKLLGITLTHRHGIPMAGIPYHAAESYMQKLLNQNIKIAVCDQVETKDSRKLVKRRLTRIITPGTRLADGEIDARRNHFLLSLELDKKGLHAAWLDLTTGRFFIASERAPETLFAAFESLDPREILVPENASKQWTLPHSDDAFRTLYTQMGTERTISRVPDYHFDRTSGAQSVMEALGVMNLDGFGIDKDHPALGVAGALIHYVTETLCAKPENLDAVREYSSEKTLLIDPATQRNLEIFKSTSGTREGSLLSAMDGTVTASGARLLEHWLCAPELNLKEIKRRQNCVGEFVEAPRLATELQTALKEVRDIERILSRLQNRIRNPRELGGIRDTLNVLPSIKENLLRFTDTPPAALCAHIHDFEKLSETLQQALADELPANINDGGTIRDGFDAILDKSRDRTRYHQQWISNFEKEEQQRTGIKTLRVRYNGAFGYFIEVSRNKAGLVPATYIRKQTMKHVERYTTDILKKYEREILYAEEKAIAREGILFNELIQAILTHSSQLRETGAALAETDVFIGWSKLAREWNYSKPQPDNSDSLFIEQGRHPVVEQMMQDASLGLAGTHAFVPNDCHLSGSPTDRNTPQIGLITGPNMAGKSTYIRQIALIVLMAQSGSWVPAQNSRIGLVDRIFSRVGANDELAQGNSTFMVEMNETANILNNATERSLVILDEIGRGTSTYDGLSIAWAVVEHLHPPHPPGPRTLFATHYHELTQLANSLERMQNYSVSVKEWNDEIIFIRQIVKGAANRSYGIQVARLAGLPKTVIDRAKAILERLESDESSQNLLVKRMRKKTADTEALNPQLNFF